ncbi:BolA family transcriptional regulator [Rhizobium sp. KVB221]|uniref:BolA family transcriptional regulator n=1 Tax=Rhizobium setariae TaxID=2801340 RepID=A0A937CLD4_9HYPH|nr:BolA family protein [Rhizobium setariae]MBL0371511.1 BolA family transcriptional regulator [Rhizobium setariae]
MTLENKIQSALIDAFAPDTLDVINESRLHAGHNREAAATGQTHFRIRISSPKFTGVSRVNCHRAINEALKFAFDEGLHALAIEIIAPPQS